MQQLFQFILGDLLSACELEMDMDIVIIMIESLGNVCDGSICYLSCESEGECVSVSVCLVDSCVCACQQCITLVEPELLVGESMQKIFTTVVALLRDYFTRRADREQRRQDPDFDEEEAERLEYQHVREEEVLGQLGDTIGKAIVSQKALFIPVFQELLQEPLFMQLLGEQSRPKDRQVALCIFDDVIVNCGEGAACYYRVCATNKHCKLWVVLLMRMCVHLWSRNALTCS
jgi:hypothetical protein